jgi:hypothetical protein
MPAILARYPRVGEKGDVLARQHSLGLQHFVQSTFGFRVDPLHPRKYLGRPFFRNTLTGYDFKASSATGLLYRRFCIYYDYTIVP